MAKFDVVESWLDNVAYSHSKSVNTRDQYKRRLQLFCDFIEKSPKQILAEYEGMSEREFRRRYAQYVRGLIGDLTNRNLASTTITGIVVATKSFFKYNDLPLAFVPSGKNRVQYHNRDLSKEEILQILKVSNVRDSGFFCMMAQTGLRPHTLANLKRKHIEPEFSQGIIPCKVEVPEEISKGKFGAYFTFMSEETINYLKAYFIRRGHMEPEDWLFTKAGSTDQINSKSMSGIFCRTVEKLKNQGLIDFVQRSYGKPRTVRLYGLRKFFRKYAGHVGVEYVNFWMGHKTNYKAPHIPASDTHYFSREDVEFQRQLYERIAMPNLRLDSATPTEREAEIVDLRKKNEYLLRQIERLQPIIDYLGRLETPQDRLSFLQKLGEASTITLEVKDGNYSFTTVSENNPGSPVMNLAHVEKKGKVQRSTKIRYAEQ